MVACIRCDTATSAASCRKSLGMHSGAIPDEAITASSSYDSISVGPAFGRYLTTSARTFGYVITRVLDVLKRVLLIIKNCP